MKPALSLLVASSAMFASLCVSALGLDACSLNNNEKSYRPLLPRAADSYHRADDGSRDTGGDADSVALYRADPALHLDRRGRAFLFHLDHHARLDDRRARRHALRSRRPAEAEVAAL